MNVNAIEVNNVCKRFKIYHDKAYTLKDRILFWHRNRYEVKWVLENISFNVKKGESLGIIGKNGSGKSTLLKILTKIIYPDKGSIKMNGRVAGLLELGAGFHPDLSGRDNVYINASIFGLSKKEIDKKFQEIVDFAELNEFIDNPVRTYSSGMYIRLAFAVAVNIHTDILLIDEILAVGDISFQEKCLNKLEEIKQAGVTIVIVSHSLEQIERFCDRSMWIECGQIASLGKCEVVHKKYKEFMNYGDK